MSEKILIACDSTCDLSAELCERYQIKILPMGVTLGGRHYTDGVDIDPDKIYEIYEQTGELPQTSAVNLGEYADFFARYTAEGYSVILFTISAEFSSSYQNACAAGADYDNVFVVDSRNLTCGVGILAVSACDMVKEGKSAFEIAEACRALTAQVDTSFVIDSLEFLHKGGRCSALAALGANLLHFKPCIAVHDGVMGVGKKYRGKFETVLKQYIADRLGDGSDIDCTRIFVIHAGIDESLFRECAELTASLAPFEDVLLSRAGCTVSSHCGRNTFGLAFLRKA